MASEAQKPLPKMEVSLVCGYSGWLPLFLCLDSEFFIFLKAYVTYGMKLEIPWVSHGRMQD